MFCYRLHPDAKAPAKNYESDAGWDLFTLEGGVLVPDEIKRFRTGIGMALRPHTYGEIKDKSGMSWKEDEKTGVLIRAGIKVGGGVIDPTYRGEIFVTLLNLGPLVARFQPGQAIAQMIIQHFIAEQFTMLDSEGWTEVCKPPKDGEFRGEKGFGSSDAKMLERKE
jgi:dUTP pyrophosphatase